MSFKGKCEARWPMAETLIAHITQTRLISMPQEFHVIRCFSCSCFQVQLSKKSTKFKCTMCGTNQTLQKVYAISSDAKDCRKVCMELNEARGEAAEAAATATHEDHLSYPDQQPLASTWGNASRSQWHEYVEDDEEEAEEEEEGGILAGRFTTSADLVIGLAKGRGKGAHMAREGGKRQRGQRSCQNDDEDEDRRRMPPPPPRSHDPIPSHHHRTAPYPNPLPQMGSGTHAVFLKVPVAPKPTGKWAAYIEEEEELEMDE